MEKLTEASKYNLTRLKTLIAQAQAKLQPLLGNAFNLNEIKYLISYTTSVVGDYFLKTNTLRLSAYVSEESDQEILNIIYHEFTHYIVDKIVSSVHGFSMPIDKVVTDYYEFCELDKHNLQTVLPKIFTKPTFLVEARNKKTVPGDIVAIEDIFNPETGELAYAEGAVVKKATDMHDFKEWASIMNKLGFGPALPENADIIPIAPNEIMGNSQDDAHGEFWQYMAKAIEKLTGCKINRWYENNQLLTVGVNYSVECPNCGWKQIANLKTDPQMFNMVQKYEHEMQNPNSTSILNCKTCGNPAKITNLATRKVIAESLLTEATRVQLASNSRNAGTYKDQSHGKNRFERKKYCKIAATVKQYNDIDMNQLFKQDRLEVKIPVIGETDTYQVTIRMDGVIAEIARNIKINKYRLEFRTVIQSLTKVFNTADIYINCNCEDHIYNFAHWNVVNNCSTLDSAHDPGPGKGVANPNDDKGRGCKHTLLVLANGDWMMKVASVINNYLHYMSEKMQKPFLKLIFPKLYGCEAEEMAELDILGKEEAEETLDSSKSFIDAINEYGKNRGKIKKGSNRNTTKRAIDEPTQGEEDIKQQEDPNKANLAKAEEETAKANKQAAKEAEKTEKAAEDTEPAEADTDLEDEES